jgi:NADH:ubiquinone oxidoreductase subunit 5 (subunit L)/multisubunit Na+/H+ antiporter MnhA subunit
LSSEPWLAWLLLAVPLAGGAVLTVTGLAGTGQRSNRAAPALGIVVAAVTLGLGIAAAVIRPAASAPLLAGMPAGVRVDGLSAVLVLTVTTVTLAVLGFSVGDLDDNDSRGRFFGLMLLFAGAMLVTVTASTLVLLLMGWELMGATSYALIGYWWREPRRVTAANTAFLVTRAADLGLYVAAGAAVAGGAGSLALSDLPGLGSPWLAVVTVGVVLAAFGKSAQLPFSFWLSRAMEGPSPVSALLHSATMVAAGAYLLLRLHPLLAASGWGEPTVAWVGAATALLLGLVAVAQTDLKQLLAASTCAQIGFMVLAAGAGSVFGGVLQLVAHAAVKSLLFLAAGAWLAALGTKQLPALRGAARRHPLVGITFSVGAVTLAGLPPASLWVSKDELLAGALQRSPGLYACGLAAAVVSAVYSIKALWYVWQPLPSDAAAGYDTEQPGTRQVTRAMRPPLAVLAVLAATLGILALPGISGPLRQTLRAAGEPTARGWELGLSAALAVLVSAVTWWWAAARPLRLPAAGVGWLLRWLDLERAAQRLLVRPTLLLARGLARFDDRVLDRGVQSLAAGSVTLARAAARLDDRGVDGLVAAVAGGARRLGQWARRPQTGQLHTYYAQAAAGFGLLAIIFVLVR